MGNSLPLEQIEEYDQDNCIVTIVTRQREGDGEFTLTLHHPLSVDLSFFLSLPFACKINRVWLIIHGYIFILKIKSLQSLTV